MKRLSSEHDRSGLLDLAVWLLPGSKLKTRLLNALGNNIAKDVRVGPNLVLRCGRITIGAEATFGSLNTLRNLASVDVGPKCFFGNFNSVTAAADFQRDIDWEGRLVLEDSAGVTSRHYIDCSGMVRIESFGAIGGVQAVIQSHEIDLKHNRASVGTITIGQHSLTATRAVVLKDAALPPQSVLGAGGVLTRSREDRPSGLYAGNPAKWIKPVDDLAWLNRTEVHTPVHRSDDSGPGSAVDAP